MKVSQLFCHSLYFTGTACTRSLGFELGTTENKSRKWPERVSNLRVWRAGQSVTLPPKYSYFEKGCRKRNVHATIPKGNMGYDQYTVPDTVAVEPTFVAFF